MNLAIRTLSSRLRKLSREELLALDPAELAEIARLLTAAKFDKLDERCGKLDLAADGAASEESGPLFWLQNHTLTTDDHWSKKRLCVACGKELLLQTESQCGKCGCSTFKPAPPKAPLPRKSYLRYVFGALLRGDPALFMPKTRDMLLSWSVCGFITHMCMWRPQTFWIAQADKEDKDRRTSPVRAYSLPQFPRLASGETPVRSRHHHGASLEEWQPVPGRTCGRRSDSHPPSPRHVF